MQLTAASTALSFLGAIHGGLALSKYKRNDYVDSDGNPMLPAPQPSTTDQNLRYVSSLLPAIVSWGTMTQDPESAIVALMVSFCLVFSFEVGAHKAGLTPSWYISLRFYWTIIVIICLWLNYYQVL